MDIFEGNDLVQKRLMKSRKLVVGFKITGHATPASKTHYVDLPGVAYLRSEGLTATADAVESVSAIVSTATDSTGVFAMLIKASELNDTMSDLVNVEVVGKPGETATFAVTKHAVTAGGNLVFTIDANEALTSGTTDGYAVIEYLVK